VIFFFLTHKDIAHLKERPVTNEEELKQFKEKYKELVIANRGGRAFEG